MRRLPAVIAALGLVAVALVGCSASNATVAGCPRPTPASTAALDLVDVTGSPDAVANVTVRSPLRTDQTQWKDIVTGDGTTITGDPHQLVVFDVTLVSGETGLRTVATEYNGNLSTVTPVSQWATVFPGLTDALQCASEGSRVVVALAPSGIALQNASNIGIGDGESAVAVIDIRKVYLPAADGAPQFNDAHGLPTVVRAPDGRPGIIIPDATAPAQPVVQVIEKGDGAVVQPTDQVRAQVLSVDWDTGQVKDTTWDSAAAPIDLSSDQLAPAVRDALAGQTVGSQILLVTPPADKTGAVAYVFDIVGIDAPAK